MCERHTGTLRWKHKGCRHDSDPLPPPLPRGARDPGGGRAVTCRAAPNNLGCLTWTQTLLQADEHCNGPRTPTGAAPHQQRCDSVWKAERPPSRDAGPAPGPPAEGRGLWAVPGTPASPRRAWTETVLKTHSKATGMF